MRGLGSPLHVVLAWEVRGGGRWTGRMHLRATRE